MATSKRAAKPGGAAKGAAGAVAKMRQPKKRGRPPLSSETRQHDAIIGVTVHRLLGWGFSLRHGSTCDGAAANVAEVVGEAARRVLGRKSAQGGALSERQVKRIYHAWLGEGLPERLAAIARSARAHSWLSKPWRRSWAPKGSLAQLAAVLLRNGGSWPRDAAAILAWAEVVLLTTSSDWFRARSTFAASDVAVEDTPSSGTVLGDGDRPQPGWKTTPRRVT